jgi:DNA invertase Pin-like site-specific DNA recombinase
MASAIERNQIRRLQPGKHSWTCSGCCRVRDESARQAEGIAKAKAAGVYKGRLPSIDVTKVRDLKKKGFGASEIAKALKIGRASVYRALET